MKGIETATLMVGDRAPEIDLPSLVSGVKQRFHLRAALERGFVVLTFYPANWDPETAQQLREYQAHVRTFAEKRAEVVGITVDSIMNTTSWEREIGPLDFPLCSDFWPHGQVCRAYGVFREEGPLRGMCERITFVISPAGRVVSRWSYRDSERPRLAEMWAALAEGSGGQENPR
jgi:peroxiredoxin (alkyl hydroperoxide reductase subunit C)